MRKKEKEEKERKKKEKKKPAATDQLTNLLCKTGSVSFGDLKKFLVKLTFKSLAIWERGVRGERGIYFWKERGKERKREREINIFVPLHFFSIARHRQWFHFYFLTFFVIFQ